MEVDGNEARKVLKRFGQVGEGGDVHGIDGIDRFYVELHSISKG